MKFSPLFTIEIEHDYFSLSKPDLFRIVPTEATERILSGAGFIVKFIKNTLYVLVKATGNDKPVIALSNDFALQFYLEVVDTRYLNITNYTNKDPYNSRLYFSNADSIFDQKEKSVDGSLYLHEKLELFENSKEYHYNDLVRSNADIAYECVAKVNANSGSLNKPKQFRKLNKESYVSARSSLLFTGPEKNLILKAPTPTVDIKYFLLNAVTGKFDKEVKHTIIDEPQNPAKTPIENVQLKFYNDKGIYFPDGIFKVTINEQEEFFYLRKTNDWQPYLGLITIHNDAFAASEDYRFLKEDGSFYTNPSKEEIETRRYKIRFAPAQYLLKYVCKTNKVKDIRDENGEINFKPFGSNKFQSSLPVRMSEKAIDTIVVEYKDSEDLKKMKTPGTGRLSVTKDENKYIVSETFLNL